MTDAEDYDAAINAAERWPTFRLRADWDGDGYQHPLADVTELAEAVTIERSLSGDLPPEIGLVEGYITASLNATLSGSWRHATVESLPRLERNYCPIPAPASNATGWRWVGNIPARTPWPASAVVTGMARNTAFRLTTADGVSPIYVRSARTFNVIEAEGEYWAAVVQWRASIAASFTVDIGWWSADGATFIGGSSAGPAVSGAPGQVMTGVVTGQSPAGAACCDVVVTVVGATGPLTLDVTAVRIDRVEHYNDNISYFDGDSTGWDWDGQPYLSTARRHETRLVAAQDVSTVLSPYREDSPLTNRSRPVLETAMDCTTGFLTASGEQATTRFYGHLTSLNPTSSTRSVDLQALDPAAQLHAAITLAAVGMDQNILGIYGGDVYRSRINSQWLVDYVLRYNGVYASPPPRDDAVLSATMHGSAIPEIGFGGAPDGLLNADLGPIWEIGPFGMLAGHDGMIRGQWHTAAPLSAAPGTGVGISMWSYLGWGSLDGSPQIEINVRQDIYGNNTAIVYGLYDATAPASSNWARPYAGIRINGQPYLSSPYNWPIPSSYAWRFVGVHLSFSSAETSGNTMVATWRIDGYDYVEYVPIPARFGAWTPLTFVNYTFFNRVTNVQIWNSPRTPDTTPWPGETHTPQASLDPGANEWTGIPALAAVDSLDLIKEIIAAEFARFGYNPETGLIEFRTTFGDSIRGRSAVTEEITADRNLSDLVATTDDSSIRNAVIVKTTMQVLQDWSDVYAATDPTQFDCGPGQTTFEVPIDPSVYQLYTDFVPYNDPTKWNTNDPTVKDKFRFMLTNKNNPFYALDPLSSPNLIVISTYRIDPWTLLIVVQNNFGFTIRFSTPWTVDSGTSAIIPGQPALIIAGRAVGPYSEDVKTLYDDSSIATYGLRSYELAGNNQWRQWGNSMATVGAGILARTANPVPVLDAINVPHDPRRKIGDQIRILDPDGLGSLRAAIVGITTTISGGDSSTSSSGNGATDAITVRPIGPPGLGLLDDPELGLADETLILAK